MTQWRNFDTSIYVIQLSSDKNNLIYLAYVLINEP